MFLCLLVPLLGMWFIKVRKKKGIGFELKIVFFGALKKIWYKYDKIQAGKDLMKTNSIFSIIILDCVDKIIKDCRL